MGRSLILRPYQLEAQQKVFDYLQRTPDKHPCVGMPTGSGKTIVIADITQKAISKWPDTHVLILSHVKEVPSHAGMGCTAELLAFHNDGFVLGHVGDSRTYSLSKGMLKQLTRDHTFVQEQLDQGLISREQAKTHSMRNLILRVVGSDDGLEVDIIPGTVLFGDIFLLCTDGLSSMVEDVQIKKILALEEPLAVKATMLIDKANNAGGKDNITVVLIEIK